MQLSLRPKTATPSGGQAWESTQEDRRDSRSEAAVSTAGWGGIKSKHRQGGVIRGHQRSLTAFQVVVPLDLLTPKHLIMSFVWRREDGWGGVICN